MNLRQNHEHEGEEEQVPSQQQEDGNSDAEGRVLGVSSSTRLGASISAGISSAWWAKSTSLGSRFRGGGGKAVGVKTI